MRFWRAILHRDFHAAGEALATGNVQETDFDALGYFIPREWMEAMVAEGLGDHTTAQAKFLAARDRAATFSRERPNSGIALIVVAQLDAALGRKDEAIRGRTTRSRTLPRRERRRHRAKRPLSVG